MHFDTVSMYICMPFHPVTWLQDKMESSWSTIDRSIDSLTEWWMLWRRRWWSRGWSFSASFYSSGCWCWCRLS